MFLVSLIKITIMKTYNYFLFISVIFLFSCKVENVSPKSISGEWKYVGDFSSLASYKCLVCPEFDYDKSIYSVTFNNDNTFNARINLLIGKGNFENSPLELNENYTSGKFSIKNLQILNKPPQTEADSYYMDKLELAKSYLISPSDNTAYDMLQLAYKDTSYLLFVRKK